LRYPELSPKRVDFRIKVAGTVANDEDAALVDLPSGTLVVIPVKHTEVRLVAGSSWWRGTVFRVTHESMLELAHEACVNASWQ
jgi:hypothetical protein